MHMRLTVLAKSGDAAVRLAAACRAQLAAGVPAGYVFPLLVPGHGKVTRPGCTASPLALSTANSQLHPTMGTFASLTHTVGGVDAADDTTLPVTTQTVCVSRSNTPHPDDVPVSGPARGHRAASDRPPDLCICPQEQPATSSPCQPLLTSPTSLLAALSLDQYVQLPTASQMASSRQASPPHLRPGGSSISSSSAAAALVKEAAHQLLEGSPTSPKATARAAGAPYK